ncbi:MAG: hypothetical protein JHD00_11440 [Akkermansiaceae bacterium]|nr:hypothetical protein [Akkermansiaceae bacterium]
MNVIAIVILQRFRRTPRSQGTKPSAATSSPSSKRMKKYETSREAKNRLELLMERMEARKKLRARKSPCPTTKIGTPQEAIRSLKVCEIRSRYFSIAYETEFEVPRTMGRCRFDQFWNWLED